MKTAMLKTHIKMMMLKDRGATAVEYGLIVALIAVVIIVGVTLLGGNLNTLFDSIADRIGGVTPAP